MNNNYNYAKERLNNIKWSEIGKNDEVWHVRLVSEYFRRISKLQIDLSPEKLRPPYYPYSLAELLESKFNVNRPNIDIYEIIPQIKEINNYKMCEYYCKYYIELAILLDRNEPLAVKYRDVYEPLIKLFESGGYFHQHDGLIYTGGGGLAKGNADYYADRKELDISDKALKIDKKNYIERIKKEMLNKASKINCCSFSNIISNKSFKTILSSSIDKKEIEVQRLSDEAIGDCLCDKDMETVVIAMFEIAERKICNDKIINILIEYSRHMDKKYELYSVWSLGHLALAVLFVCNNEVARKNYEKITSNIDNGNKRCIEHIIRII